MLASTNGYVISTSRPAGFTTTFHITLKVHRKDGRSVATTTACGTTFINYELYDTLEDVPEVIGPNQTHLCTKCQDLG